eukprot:m.34059 g.34059  ORF g.34059 m.34059 type:complete len:209 (-) comp9900_c0_seq1:658-1284(-)
MAKKKKAGGKKKKEGGAPSAKQAIVAPGPTQLEISLRLELESLEKELLLAKQEAEEAKQKNQFLKSEADSAREETNDYESYMQKKTVREQLKIQNLMDENQKKLDTIAADKLRKTKEFEDIKKGFQEMILEKENELSKILEQIEDLDEFVVWMTSVSFFFFFCSSNAHCGINKRQQQQHNVENSRSLLSLMSPAIVFTLNNSQLLYIF